MSMESIERDDNNSTMPREIARPGRWVRSAAVVVATVTVSLVLGMTSSFAATTATSAAAPSARSQAAAVVASQLGSFDTALLKMINAKRATVGAVALKEVVGLDNASATWSSSVVALGRYGKVVPNPNIAAQTLSAAPARVAFAQSVAKWYPQSVKAADVFSLYTQYPKTMADMTNNNYKFVGIRTVVAADGTSVATLTYTDTAVATQVVGTSTATTPTGKLVGNADTLRQSGTQLTASGWGYDTAAPTTPLKATVVLTGKSGSRTMTILLNGARSDIARVFPAAGPAHGFRIAVPNLGKGATTMCVTLLPASSASVALKLTCRSLTVS